jgi:hypothetical protein
LSLSPIPLLSCLLFLAVVTQAPVSEHLVAWCKSDGQVTASSPRDDGIVLGELQQGKWMAGSNFYMRTEKTRDIR